MDIVRRIEQVQPQMLSIYYINMLDKYQTWPRQFLMAIEKENEPDSPTAAAISFSEGGTNPARFPPVQVGRIPIC
eukprot:809351-Pyramimonas_sp.AAC.1